MNYENLNDIDKLKGACLCGENQKALEYYNNSSFDLKDHFPEIIEKLCEKPDGLNLERLLRDFGDQIKEVEHKINKSLLINSVSGLGECRWELIKLIYNNIKPEEKLLSADFEPALSKDDLEMFKFLFINSDDRQREAIDQTWFLNKTFYEACEFDAIKIAKYLYYEHGADFKYNCDQAFRRTRRREEIKENKNCQVINWLLTLAPRRYYINENYEPCIDSNFEF